jgi:hypothetical protein
MSNFRLSHLSISIFFGIIFLFFTSVGKAQNSSAPTVGRGAAAKYFQAENPEPPRKSYSGENFLYLMAGPFASSSSYAWKGGDKRTGTGRQLLSVTYLFDQWNSIDVNLRLDLIEYKLDEENPSKLTITPFWTFPLVETRFPIYFGLGTGLGIFLKQIENESNISFDYQIATGIRVPELIGSAGVVFELALKNHLHLLSDGQFIGTSIGAGAIFSF